MAVCDSAAPTRRVIYASGWCRGVTHAHLASKGAGDAQVGIEFTDFLAGGIELDGTRVLIGRDKCVAVPQPDGRHGLQTPCFPNDLSRGIELDDAIGSHLRN